MPCLDHFASAKRKMQSHSCPSREGWEADRHTPLMAQSRFSSGTNLILLVSTLQLVSGNSIVWFSQILSSLKFAIETSSRMRGPKQASLFADLSPLPRCEADLLRDAHHNRKQIYS